MTRSRGKSTPNRGFGMVSLIFAAMVVTPMACSQESGGVLATYTTRDSAGVQIVESLRPAWGESDGWRVGPDALVRIGTIEGEEAYQFSRIAGVARLSDGGFIVGDETSQELRFFDNQGHHLRTVGRRGEGPGEFTGLSVVGVGPRGRAWTYDFSLRRITWFDPDGEMTGLTSLELEPPTLSAEGPLPDGTFLLKQLWGTGGNSEVNELGLQRDPLAWVSFDEEGELVDTVSTVPGRELFVFEEDGRGVMSTPPFARNSVGTIRGDRIVVGDQEKFQMDEFDSSGTLLRIFRIPGRVEAVTSQDLEAYIQGRLATAPPERHPSLRQSLEEMPHPDTQPAYGAIFSDSSGNLWVGEWAMYPDFALSWTVFDTEGCWLGEVEVPDRFDPRVIGEDWILGVERDELDVEYVVLYPLERGY
jgi:hypothetical protein